MKRARHGDEMQSKKRIFLTAFWKSEKETFVKHVKEISAKSGFQRSSYFPDHFNPLNFQRLKKVFFFQEGHRLCAKH